MCTSHFSKIIKKKSPRNKSLKEEKSSQTGIMKPEMFFNISGTYCKTPEIRNLQIPA